jgi:hypothetical protein
MNFENIGINICKITTKTKDKDFDDIPIYIASREERPQVHNIISNIQLLEENEIIQQMPYQDTKKGITRQILYISGSSGSGKSYLTSKYLKEYTKKFPKNPIYIFSSLTEDKTIDECKNTVRIKFDDESFYQANYTIENFQDSLVLYDDTEMISDRFVATKLKNLQDLILTTGRHFSVYCIITSHVCHARERTKLILIESNSITLFLDTMGTRNLTYALQSGFGFTKKQIDSIRRLESRWITILRTAPITILNEKGISVLTVE